ncbi:hypothetical protein HGO53_05635 [Wolbachia endosymbiont of Diaphorina citri]|uniref:hypothetical protein n=1 Tax=Wolbachia endosymbiont of Diaphorina citri TaxID=116598 RepID=UPI000374607C|nr:hypothetical protein [Wolbachia endosymbiont of Diaphorina citri]QJT94712.1 hypothetical protein HGO48_04925 [Wolbachia endosymbiont of Diaphorina citri]QJT95951.1 hypothetical protein HGO49_04925 [Wolbachia endosymbiont of Diaphorina citri]QJT97312.1 hypothetical protein HGO53_05635 [Wolbachia endosymbiont of Diaphorina citri]QLK11608.1 hypothetical protein FK497_04985 [Wolbachia endosymbiont of Diaphorina citri]QXY86858.1 hypothetical protein GZ064_02620 [Wolbachia endosymbiont of Diaphor
MAYSKNLTSFDHQIKSTPADIVRISDRWLIFDEHGIKNIVKANAEPKEGMFKKVCQTEFLVQLNFQSVGV